jgi:hypothetical protein
MKTQLLIAIIAIFGRTCQEQEEEPYGMSNQEARKLVSAQQRPYAVIYVPKSTKDLYDDSLAIKLEKEGYITVTYDSATCKHNIKLTKKADPYVMEQDTLSDFDFGPVIKTADIKINHILSITQVPSDRCRKIRIRYMLEQIPTPFDYFENKKSRFPIMYNILTYNKCDSTWNTIESESESMLRFR